MNLHDTLIIFGVLGGLGLLLWPRVYKNAHWRATITPLASIIGSGFLVLGPILVGAFGAWAILAMLGLCVLAYLFGMAIRFNITRLAAPGGRSVSEERFEIISSWALGFAYIISVAYYLNLFGAFGVHLTPFDSPLAAKILTSLVFLVILAVGWLRGFGALERMEQLSVSLKLAIIVGLLVGLVTFFIHKTADHQLFVLPAKTTGWAAISLSFGLLVTIQGFETSRYLGAQYSPKMRIRTMRWSQWISSAIYLIYIWLLSFVFSADQIVFSETGIIEMMKMVAPILPFLLVVAALSAQFSAAIADTGGAGGLLSELSKTRISVRGSYAILVGIGLVLTWSADIFTIIRFASQAFAFYYALQAAIAAIGARKAYKSIWRSGLFVLLFLLGLSIVVFGQSIKV